jgi:hypothetical protein
MSIFSILGKLGAVAGAPFTGGASLAALPMIDALGKGASSAAQSMAGNRGTNAELTLDANDQFERELLARELEKRASRNDALRQSIFGSMLAQYHAPQRPAGISGSPFASLGATGMQAADFGAADALRRLQAGDTLPALERPDLSKFMKSSIWEKLLGIGGAAASAYGAAGTMQPHGQPTNYVQRDVTDLGASIFGRR